MSDNNNKDINIDDKSSKENDNSNIKENVDNKEKTYDIYDEIWDEVEKKTTNTEKEEIIEKVEEKEEEITHLNEVDVEDKFQSMAKKETEEKAKDEKTSNILKSDESSFKAGTNISELFEDIEDEIDESFSQLDEDIKTEEKVEEKEEEITHLNEVDVEDKLQSMAKKNTVEKKENEKTSTILKSSEPTFNTNGKLSDLFEDVEDEIDEGLLQLGEDKKAEELGIKEVKLENFLSKDDLENIDKDAKNVNDVYDKIDKEKLDGNIISDTKYGTKEDKDPEIKKETKIDDKTKEPVKKEIKEPKLKDDFPSSPDANMRFDNLSNMSKSFIGNAISKDSYKKEIQEMTKNMDGLTKEQKQAEFGRRYSKFYRDNLTSLFNQRTTSSNKNGGKGQLPIDETFDRYEKFMAAADQELKESGFLAEDYDRLKPGTVSSHNIRDAISSSLQNQNPKNSKDEKDLASLYGKLNTKQKQASFDGLSKNIDNLNKQFGTKFNAKNIEKYLAQEFKKCDGLSTKEMQEQFKGKYEAFMKSALNSMLNKRQGDSKNSLNDSIEALDKFSKSLEYVLKADGFLDTEYHHESLGGVKKDDVKASLENHVNKLPKTMNEEMEAKLNSFGTLDEKHDYVAQLMDKVPDAKEGVNNTELKQAMIALNILDKQMANRTTGEKIKHPFQKGQNDKFIENAQEFLEKKGYDKEVLNSVTKNGIKEEEDPIVQRQKDNKEDLNNTMKNLETKEIEREESIKARNQIISHPGKQIEVPECDTRQEIVCQKNQVEKNLQLQVQKTNELKIEGTGLGSK